MKKYYRVYYDDKNKSDGKFVFLSNSGKVITLNYYAYMDGDVLRDFITHDIIKMKKSFQSNEGLNCYVKILLRDNSEVLTEALILKEHPEYLERYISQIDYISSKRREVDTKTQEKILAYYKSKEMEKENYNGKYY